MIDRSFLEKIEEMSASVETLVAHNAIYAPKPVYLVEEPAPDALPVHSLTAIVDYCLNMASKEAADNRRFFINVVSPGMVIAFSGLSGANRTREEYMRSTLSVDSFPFGIDMAVEKFIIALQSQFVPSDNVSAILKVVGNITAEAEQKTLDDGVSQQITAKTGIATVKNVTLPNPITLAPYRTFHEIDQPESKFVLRINAKVGEKPTVSLHEADGGAWKNTAILSIKEWLVNELTDVTVLA